MRSASTAPLCFGARCDHGAVLALRRSQHQLPASRASGTNCAFTLKTGYTLTSGTLNIACSGTTNSWSAVITGASCTMPPLPDGALPGSCTGSTLASDTYCYYDPKPCYVSVLNPYVQCEGGAITSVVPQFVYGEYGRGVQFDVHPNAFPMTLYTPSEFAMNPAETMGYLIDRDWALWELTRSTGAYRQMISATAKQWTWAYGLIVNGAGTILYLCDTFTYGMFSITLPGGIATKLAVAGGSFQPRCSIRLERSKNPHVRHAGLQWPQSDAALLEP